MGRNGPWWHAFDYIFLMRPTLMPAVWSLFLFGLCHAPGNVQTTNTPHMFLSLGLLTLVMGAGYIHNQLHDIESDRINNKLFLLPEGHISVPSARRLYISCTLIAIAGAWIYAYWLGLLIVLSALLSYAYNAPPFRWKDRPIAGVLANSTGYGYVAFAIGWGTASAFTWPMLTQSIPYAMGCGSFYLLTTVLDAEGDKAAGKITIGVKYGFISAVIVSILFLVTGIISAFLVENYIIAFPYLVSLPLFFWTLKTLKVSHAKITLGFSTLAFSMAAIVCYPPYMGILILLFIMIKLYYKHRFNFDYPPLRMPRET